MSRLPSGSPANGESPWTEDPLGPWRRQGSLIAATERWARELADVPVLLFEGQATTWSELNERGARVAGGLAAAGIRKGDRIGLLLRNQPAFFEVLLACARIGAVLVSLNIRLIARELAEIAADCDPAALVTEEAFAGVLGGLADVIPASRTYFVGSTVAGGRSYDELAGADPREPAVNAPDDPFLIQYSSGTTGRAKGVVLTHGSVAGTVESEVECDRLTASDRVAMPVPLAFTGSLVSTSIPFLYAGGSILLEQELVPEALLEHVEHDGVTFLGAVPVVFQSMANCAGFERADLSNLRVAKSGGAPVPESLLRTYQAKGVQMVGAYALTEGGGINTQLPGEEALRKLGFAGVPLANQRLRIAGEDDATLPPGEIGEILIQSPSVMKEYWRNPEATSEAFRGGWLHTGDLGLLDEEGYLKVIDRKKDLLICGGINVYPAEIERALCEHPGVAEAAVVGAPHERWGEVPVAFVVRKDPALAEADLEELAVELLASFKRPHRYEFVDALPRNMSNKILKRELRARLLAEDAGTAGPGAASSGAGR